MKEIWTEKYRPKVLDDVYGQSAITKRLKSYVTSGNLPHLLFAGPPGTGKTTSAIALVRELFGEELWRTNFQELNASDERGIGVVRTKIKDFARTAPMGVNSFKVIFLDEADALTPEAQAALRRTMERYTSTCRFVISCNYSSKIIEPLQSRCAVFRFRLLREEDIRTYIEKIAKIEGLDITKDGYDALIYVANGDMRKAINSLQVGATLGEKIDANTIYESTATAKPDDIKKMMVTALEGDFMETRAILDELIIDHGLSGEDILRQVHRDLFKLSIPEDSKVRLVDKLGEVEFRLVEGSNERIQIEAFLAHAVLEGNRIKAVKK